MAWHDVAKAYHKVCEQDNMTDGWKARCEFGMIEGGFGVGFEDVD